MICALMFIVSKHYGIMLQHQTLLPPSTIHMHESTQRLPVYQSNNKNPNAKPPKQTNSEHHIATKPNPMAPATKTKPLPAYHTNTKPSNPKPPKQTNSETPIATKPNHMVPATKIKPSTTTSTTTQTTKVRTYQVPTPTRNSLPSLMSLPFKTPLPQTPPWILPPTNTNPHYMPQFHQYHSPQYRYTCPPSPPAWTQYRFPHNHPF